MTVNSPAYDVIDMLITGGVSTSILFCNDEPLSPDTVITVYDTGGLPPNPKLAVDYPTIQIRSRSNSFSTAYQNLLTCRNILISKAKVTVNTTVYVGFWVQSDITSIGKDENDRSVCVLNMRMVTEPPSGGNRLSL